MEGIKNFLLYPFTFQRSDSQKKAIKEFHDNEISKLQKEFKENEDKGTYVSTAAIMATGILGIGLPIIAYKISKKKRRRSITRSKIHKKSLVI